jgi:hypothetical protein
MFVVHQPARTIIAELRDKFRVRANFFQECPKKTKAGVVPAFV